MLVEQIDDNLRANEILHDVAPEARVCDCGREKAKIGEDVTEQLEYEPGKLFVFRHVDVRSGPGRPAQRQSGSPIHLARREDSAGGCSSHRRP